MSTGSQPVPAQARLAVPGPRPNPADRQYLVLKERDLGPSAAPFNGESGRRLRAIDVHGVTVRLAAQQGEPLAIYNGAMDVQRFTVYADKVEIRGRFALFGCHIEINARVLDGAAGTLITNGIPLEATLIADSREPTRKAIDGQPGGRITLNVGEGSPPQIFSTGAPAQMIGRYRTYPDRVDPLNIRLNDPGERVAAFFASPFRDEKMAKALRDPKILPGAEPWKKGDLSEDWQWFIWPELHKIPDGQSALGSISYVEVTLPPPLPGHRWNTGPYLLGRPEGPWTDDASKYPPAGTGGAGGEVESTIAVGPALRKQTGGVSSLPVEGQQQPSPAVHLKMTLGPGHPRPGPGTASFERKQKKPPAPPPRVTAKEGGLTTITKSDKRTDAQILSMCQYLKDCYREGYVDEAGRIANLLPAASSTQSDPVRDQLAEVAALKSKLAEKRDYYGNPPNWVPLLSVETNVGLFHGEVDRALQLLYLAHLISSRWHDQTDRIQILDEALEQTRTAMATHQQSLMEAVSACGVVQGQIDVVKQESDAFKKSLDDLRRELQEEAKKRVDEKLAWEKFKSVLNLLGSVASVIPVGQPYLNLGTTALNDVLATSFNPDQPIDQKLIGLVERASAGVRKGVTDKEVTSHIESLTADQAAMQVLYDDGANLAKQKKTLEAKVASSPDKAALVKVNQDIAANEKKIAAATKKNSAEVAALAKSVSNFADLATATAALAKTFLVDRAEVEKQYQTELAKLEKDSVRFQGIKSAFDLLTRRKEDLLAKVLTLQQVAVQAASQRVSAVNRLETLKREREKDQSVLNPDVKFFADRLEKDSVDTLRKYFYFLLRSWEYYFLQPAAQAFDPTAIAKKIREFLQANQASVTLTEDQFKQLKAAYLLILSNMGRQLVDKLQTEQPRRTAEQNVSLDANQIRELNTAISIPVAGTSTPAKVRRISVNFEKMNRLPPFADDLRIARIELEPVISAADGKPLPENITLRLWHSGTSVIVRDRERYDFVSSGPNARMMWGITYHAATGKKTPIGMADEVSAETLSELFGGKISQIRRYSPAYLGDLELTVFSDPMNAEFQLTSLLLKITYEHHPLSS